MLIEPSFHGPVNITAPHPLRNKDFINVLTKTLRKPNMITTPSFLLELTLGDMHQLITSGQYVLPQKALDQQFTFVYPYLENALADIYQ